MSLHGNVGKRDEEPTEPDPEELAMRIFSLTMLGLIATILLMVITGNW